jgi:hypothetical protein
MYQAYCAIQDLHQFNGSKDWRSSICWKVPGMLYFWHPFNVFFRSNVQPPYTGWSKWEFRQQLSTYLLAIHPGAFRSMLQRQFRCVSSRIVIFKILAFYNPPGFFKVEHDCSRPDSPASFWFNSEYFEHKYFAGNILWEDENDGLVSCKLFD